MEYFAPYFAVVSFLLGLGSCQQNSGEIVYSIPEEKPQGYTVGNILASTNLQYPDLQFTLLSKNSPLRKYLTMDETTSLITTQEVIDRESEDLCAFRSECQFPLEVSVRSSSPFFEIIKIIVVIQDINDNAPVFEESSIDWAISEGVPIGETFSFPGARDRDTSSEFSLRSFDMKSVYPTVSLPFVMNFTISLDGGSKVILRTTRELDRETRDSYLIEIVAKDGGTPDPQTGTLYVNVTVLDINDNDPQFSLPAYNVTVPEDVTPGTVILNITASDPDAGTYGQVRYKLSERQSREILELFAIDEVTGALRITSELRTNAEGPYTIIVEASDGQKTRYASVTVNVLDTRNNAPEVSVDLLTKETYAETTEYANVGAVVAYIIVTDDDSGRNGDVQCTIQGGWFGLQRYFEKQYKVIVARSLNRELDSVINVTVICQDKGTPPLSSTSVFSVHVLDENDNAPRFNQSRYYANIVENNEIGDKITTVSAFDIDVGNNSAIRYQVSQNSSKYAFINPITGDLMANYKFDRENATNVTLVVTAEDRGTPPLTGTALVIVNVKDANDNKPVFTQASFRMWIRENLPADSTVGWVSATDDDKGDNARVTFALNPKWNSVPFVVFPDGLVKTDRELDREAVGEYQFEVIATDHGVPSQSSVALVTAFVDDENDEIPTFTFPVPMNNTVYVPYLTSPNTVIGNVIVTDNDKPGHENSNLRYSLTTRNSTYFFSIDNNGDVYLVAPLGNPDMISNVYVLDVHVTDKGDSPNKVSAVLRVVITSQNGTVTSEPETKQNFFIAVIVSAITIVLSAGIIVTICIIRRLDTRRRKNNVIRGKVLSDNLYPKKENTDVFACSTLNHMYSDKRKKEVSFSLDEDSVIDTSNVNVVASLPVSGHYGNHVGGEGSQDLDAVDHILLEPPPQYMQLEKPMKRLDDAHSDMSGDSGTADSGKGGSDDDIQLPTGVGSSHDNLKPKERWNQRRSKSPGVQPLQTFTRYQQPSPDNGAPQQKIIPFSFRKPGVYPGGSMSPRSVALTTGPDNGMPMYYEEDSSNGSSGFLSIDGNSNFQNGYRGDVSSDIVV